MSEESKRRPAWAFVSLANQSQQDRLLRVETILRLGENDAPGAVDDVGVELVAAPRGKAMHEDRHGLGVSHELRRHLERLQDLMPQLPALRRDVVAHPGIRVDG